MKIWCFALSMILFAGSVWAQQAARSPEAAEDPAALQAEIEAFKLAKLAWREIAWKSCLLDGLRESREQNKPALLWIFIDRPADDGRC